MTKKTRQQAGLRRASGFIVGHDTPEASNHSPRKKQADQPLASIAVFDGCTFLTIVQSHDQARAYMRDGAR